MAITQLRPQHTTGRRYGSFAGRPSGTPTTHPVGILTQLRPQHVTGRRYGSFAGRPEGAQEEIVDVGKTGLGGIERGGVRRRTIVKPTGLIDRAPRKEGRDDRKSVEERVEEAREIHAEIAGTLARELRGEIERSEKSIAEMTMAEVDREIGVLLRKVQRTENEEILLLMLLAVA